MTWLLQPLDTHVFALFKRTVRSAVQRARCEADVCGHVVQQVLLALCEAVEAVLLGRGWASAFESNGFGSEQAGLSQRVLQSLALETVPVVPRGRPSVESLRHCFPRRAHVIAEEILAAAGCPFAPPAPAPAAAPRAAPLPPPSAPVTRSMTRAASSSVPALPKRMCKRPAAAK